MAMVTAMAATAAVMKVQLLAAVTAHEVTSTSESASVTTTCSNHCCYVSSFEQYSSILLLHTVALVRCSSSSITVICSRDGLTVTGSCATQLLACSSKLTDLQSPQDSSTCNNAKPCAHDVQ
jgi:hypothetical protein